jgi:5-methylcytosine-specific restriction endonuclease McrA
VKAWDSANRDRRNAWGRRWRRDNPEKARARDRLNNERYREQRRRYNVENRDRVQAVQRDWERRNRDKCRAAHRKWRAENPDLARDATRRWQQQNRERVRASLRAYRRANPELVRLWDRRKYDKRRMAIAATYIPFTAQQLAQRLSMFAGCWMCGGPKESVDHVKPLAKGGAHMLCNLRPACQSCNTRKNGRWPYKTSLLM